VVWLLKLSRSFPVLALSLLLFSQVNDGHADSDPATVTINVTPVNHAPQATNSSVDANVASSTIIDLSG
jgi:hypothetical protein